ncbi:MAG: D-2-hydroxyacid dehydrogenase [Burkholderiales bacterium]|nr:D-2-hydroxyacid dehydrogenase [Burkholderiales bacterium]
MPKLRIFITSPLEPANVERIRQVAPDRLEVDHQPDLLPELRYVADHVGRPLTRTPGQERRWIDALSRADILWDLPRKPGDLAVSKRVRWIQTTSTGVGQSVRSLGLDKSDIVVTTARGVHAGPLAEFVFMALLMHWRGFAHLQSEQRERRWLRYCGEEVAGRRIVIVGAGDLARGIAQRARAFELKVTAIGREAGKERRHDGLFDEVQSRRGLHAALAEADATIVTVPHTAQTERMIDGRAFAAMKKNSAFINIARGQVVDEPALIEALRSGHLGFAALDVATVEPLPPDSPLWTLPNVLISPHSASTVPAENSRITDIFCRNLRCWLDGRFGDMHNVLDKQALY